MDSLLGNLKVKSAAAFRFATGRLSRLALTKGSIRAQILIFCLAMSAVAVALGGYSILGIRHAGDLVAKTFDESLMSINYARAAGADFASMRVASSQRLLTTDPDIRAGLDSQIEKLAKTLSEDLTIAADRSQSSRAAQAAAKVQEAADAWMALHRRAIASSVEGNSAVDPHASGTTVGDVDRYSRIVSQQVELLVNYTAGDGFLFRQKALSTIKRDLQLNVAGLTVALFLSALFSWLLDVEPVQFARAYYRGATPQTATLIAGTNDAAIYTIDPALDGGKNVYRRDWIENAEGAQVVAFSNGIAVAAASNWWTPNSIIDLDFQNSRFRINGTNYASIADAKTANAIKVNSSGVEYIDVAGLGAAYAIGAKAVTPNMAYGATGTFALAVLEDGEDGDTIDEAVRVGWHMSLAQWRAAGYVRAASTSRLNTTEGLIVAPASPIRTGLRVKSASYYQAANGQPSGSSTNAGSLPSVSRFMWGKMSSGSLAFTGTLQRVVLVNAELDNDQINALLA